MSTARGIANSVASTMKNALKIHSPSRLMRDDVGKWIPEGIAVGIRDNAKSVYNELDSLSTGMLRVSTPEAALGAFAMRSSSFPSNSGSQGSTSTKNNLTLTLHYHGNDPDDADDMLDRIDRGLAQRSSISTWMKGGKG